MDRLPRLDGTRYLPHLNLTGPNNAEALRNASLLRRYARNGCNAREDVVNGLIYLIGLIVVVLFILSFLGLR